MQQSRLSSQISLIAALMTLALGCTTRAHAGDMVQVPSPNGTMNAEVYQPSGSGTHPVLIFSHGRAPERSDRENLRNPMPSAHISYWTEKGFTVVVPIRPGYGPGSGGQDFENSNNQSCTVLPDYAHVANAGATAIVATVNWVRQQPWARKDRILLEGQSVGGMSTVAAAAKHPQGVVGYINFAGGSGGDPKRTPQNSCHPEVLTKFYGSLGGSTRLPGIWFYAENDLFWGPDVPKQWGQAFNSHGGRATLVYTGPSGSNGHNLMRNSPELWSGQLDAFVKARGF